MPPTDATFFWLCLTCFALFALLGMAIVITIQLAKENHILKLKLGKEEPREEFKLGVYFNSKLETLRTSFERAIFFIWTRIRRPKRTVKVATLRFKKYTYWGVRQIVEWYHVW